TIQDVLDSPWVVYPFHVLDCCLVTDAGGAVVLTTMDRARDLGVPLVEVLGSAVAHTHHQISQMPDLTTTPARLSGQAAYAQAGVGPGDIDVAELYDSFTYTVLVSLEDLGFCAKGEGGDFVTGQRTAPGGDFPLNTSGGGLSYTHPGMFGMFLLIEAVQQLRGECGQRQVPGAEVALVNGMGGYLSSAATAILARVCSPCTSTFRGPGSPPRRARHRSGRRRGVTSGAYRIVAGAPATSSTPARTAPPAAPGRLSG